MEDFKVLQDEIAQLRDQDTPPGLELNRSVLPARMKAIYNLTPHAINIYADDGTTLQTTIPSSGELRLQSAPQRIGTTIQVDGLRLPLVERQQFEGLDVTSPGYSLYAIKCTELSQRVGFIVSMPVAEFLRVSQIGAAIFAPDTGPRFVVRSATGQIIGTRCLDVYSIATNILRDSAIGQTPTPMAEH